VKAVAARPRNGTARAFPNQHVIPDIPNPVIELRYAQIASKRGPEVKNDAQPLTKNGMSNRKYKP
jgi:hypothetical protein